MLTGSQASLMIRTARRPYTEKFQHKIQQASFRSPNLPESLLTTLSSIARRLLCRCGPCLLPFGRIADGRLVIASEHKGKTHYNELTPADLRALADALEQTKGMQEG